MKIRKQETSTTALMLAAVSLFASGCTATIQDVPSPTASQAITTPTPTATASQVMTTLKAFDAPGSDEKLLGKLDSQRGTKELGPYKAPKLTVIYLDCYGNGIVTLDIIGVGKFPTQCTAETTKTGTRNSFDTSFVDSISINISGPDSILWAASAYAAQK